MIIRCEEERVTLSFAEDYKMDETIVTVDAWYDKHSKAYCIQLLNKDGFQIGNAIWCGNKADKEHIVKELNAEYGL